MKRPSPSVHAMTQQRPGRPVADIVDGTPRELIRAAGTVDKKRRIRDGDLRLGFAADRDDYLRCFRLVHDRYVETGLIAANVFGLRVVPMHLLPTTDVFVAYRGDKLVGTLTLILDGALGVPLEGVYPEVIASARAAGRRFGEVASLAFGGGSSREFLRIFVALTRTMAQSARRRGIEELYMMVNPRHVSFYERKLAFTRVGDERPCPSVKQAPAIACRLNFADSRTTHPESYRDYFGVRMPSAPLVPPRMSAADVEYFRAATEMAEAGLAVPAG